MAARRNGYGDGACVTTRGLSSVRDGRSRDDAYASHSRREAHSLRASDGYGCSQQRPYRQGLRMASLDDEHDHRRVDLTWKGRDDAKRRETCSNP